MSQDVEYEDWMSEGDALLWQIERDPLLRSTVTSVWVLDRPVDDARWDATMERSVAAIPRLRQRVVPDGLGIAPPRWEVDPHFDPAYHVRRVGVAVRARCATCSTWPRPSPCRPSTRTGRSGSSTWWTASPRAAPASS